MAVVIRIALRQIVCPRRLLAQNHRVFGLFLIVLLSRHVLLLLLLCLLRLRDL